MKNEIIKRKFCIQCGNQFVSEWSDPQFTSYYLSTFDNVHLFNSKEEAAKESVKFSGAVIKRIKLTIITELEE